MTDQPPSSPSSEPGYRAADLRVSARAVVVDQEGRVLLIRHGDNGKTFHVLPGGRVESGETAAEAARREVHEETGLQVDIGELLWVREYLPERHPGHPWHRTRMRQLQLYFRARFDVGAATLPTAPDRTQTAVVWQPLSAIGDLVLLPLGLTSSLSALGAEPRVIGAAYLGDLP